MIGIYKITNPNDKVYIGQSINIESRFRSYKNLKNCKNQKALLRSFIKHGVENHIFSVIEECDINQLNDRERYWQDFYNVLDRENLNCKLTTAQEKSGKLSDKTKEKIKEKRALQKIRHTEETKKKIGDAHKGKTLSDSHIESLRKPKSMEHREKMRGPRPNAKKPKNKIKCPHCDKEGAPNVMKRFHFDNCGITQHNKKVECPHCKKEVDGANAKRWHFDNCKLNLSFQN